ncbi:MAG: hypothetical protein ACXVIS_07555 [Halobacteriota archaeon]
MHQKNVLNDCYRVTKAYDLLSILEDAMNEVRKDSESTPIQRARALGYLVGLTIRVVKAADLESRVAALERVLAMRPQSRADARERP